MYIRRPRHLQLRSLIAGVSLGNVEHLALARAFDVRLVGYFMSTAQVPENDNA